MGVVRECWGTAVEDCSSGYHPAYFGGQLYGVGQRLAMIKQNVSSRNLRCCPPSLPLTNRINAITSMLPFVSPLLVSGALSCRHIALHTWTLLQPLPFCQRGTHAHARPSHLDRQHCSAGATMHQLDLSFFAHHHSIHPLATMKPPWKHAVHNLEASSTHCVFRGKHSIPFCMNFTGSTSWLL